MHSIRSEIAKKLIVHVYRKQSGYADLFEKVSKHESPDYEKDLAGTYMAKCRAETATIPKRTVEAFLTRSGGRPGNSVIGCFSESVDEVDWKSLAHRL